MSMERILSEIRSYDGVLELAPVRGDEHPEISWGDHFFYYAPSGEVPRNRQPYATIVTKDYPDDADSQLNAADRWRLNINVGSQLFTDLLGYAPSEIDGSRVDHSVADTFAPHPLYGPYGWISVVNPGSSTLDTALNALLDAHLADKQRVERRQSRSSSERNE